MPRFTTHTLRYSHEIETEILGEWQYECYDFVIRCRVPPGDPGCYRTPNGDGWPPSGPEVEFLSAVCESLNFGDDDDYELTAADGRGIGDWFLGEIEANGELCRRLTEVCLAEAEEDNMAAYEAACESGYQGPYRRS